MLEEMTEVELREFEDLLDRDFESQTPVWMHREEGALLLTLCYEMMVAQRRLNLSDQQAVASELDAPKHALMHAFRWVAGRPSRAVDKGDRQVLSKVESADELLRWAQEYQGIFSVFTAYSRGRLRALKRADGGVKFIAKSRLREHWKYTHLQPEPRRERANLTAELAASIGQSVQYERLGRDEPLGIRTYLVDWGSVRRCHSIALAMASMDGFLPDRWSIHGVSIAAARSVFAALVVQAEVHLDVLLRQWGGTPVGYEALLWLPREALISQLCQLSNQSPETVRFVIGILTLSWSEPGLDPGVTPLIPLGSQNIAYGAQLVSSAALERNWYRMACRRYKDECAELSNLVSTSYVEELESAFRERGYLTRIEAPLTVDEHATDIDLAVYSKEEALLLTMEVKAYYAPADPAEIYRREAECSKALSSQTALHVAATKRDLVGLFKRLFPDEHAPTRLRSATLLVVRGYRGSEYLQSTGVTVVEGAELLTYLRRFDSLSVAMDKLSSGYHLAPRKGKYILTSGELKTPTVGTVEIPLSVLRRSGRRRSRAKIRGSYSRRIWSRNLPIKDV